MNVDPDRMVAAADQASALLKSLGNRHRLLMLCQLTEGERSVGDLATFLDLRDSTVSQHLSLLRRDGLVQGRRDGQTIWYSIASAPARRVLEALFEIYCKSAAPCRRPAERRAPKPRAAGRQR
jgi:DNA-binding transcriptional ArsR family regulator